MDLTPAKILIVDDEPGLLFSLKAYLEDEGYVVSGVTSGKEALHAMDETVYDAVIIDVRLPDIDGNEVILEAEKKGMDSLFLIHTGSTDYELPNSLKRIGFTEDDIFLKPISNLNEFCQILENRISIRKSESNI